MLCIIMIAAVTDLAIAVWECFFCLLGEIRDLLHVTTLLLRRCILEHLYQWCWATPSQLVERAATTTPSTWSVGAALSLALPWYAESATACISCRALPSSRAGLKPDPHVQALSLRKLWLKSRPWQRCPFCCVRPPRRRPVDFQLKLDVKEPDLRKIMTILTMIEEPHVVIACCAAAYIHFAHSYSCGICRRLRRSEVPAHTDIGASYSSASIDGFVEVVKARAQARLYCIVSRRDGTCRPSG
jgi:hypothetical protein